MALPAVLREEPQFRLLFAGQALSVLGDRLMLVALPFAVLATPGAGATQVGLVVAAQTVPFAIFALLAGVWADRLDRRRILIASDLVRMAAQAVAGALLVADVAQWWHLALLALPFGAADAFFQPAMTGLMPQVVGPGRLQAANALRSLTYSSGLLAGPALAGVLVAGFGPGTALLFDAATFAVSVACLLPLRPRRVERDVEPEARMLAALKGGLREIQARPWIARFLGALCVYHLIVLPAIYVLGPVLADAELGGAEAWALITGAFGIGAILGDLLMLRWRPDRPMAVACALLIGASTQAAIIGSGLPLLAIAALELLTGVCLAVLFTLWQTALQEHVPDHAISRVSSVDYFLSVGAMPVGVALAGPVAAAVGLRTTMFAMTAIGIAAAVAALAAQPVRALRRQTG